MTVAVERSVEMQIVQEATYDQRRWWVLPIMLVGSFLSFLDFFIVNIALPSIRSDLKATPLTCNSSSRRTGSPSEVPDHGRPLRRHFRKEKGVSSRDSRFRPGFDVLRSCKQPSALIVRVSSRL